MTDEAIDGATDGLIAALLTLGDPHALTGGSLYQARMIERADQHGFTVRTLSYSDRPFPLPALQTGDLLRQARGADVLLLDSIVAAYVGAWLNLAQPAVAIVHQQPGGIGHGLLRHAVQRALDRRAYRHARRLIVPSRYLAERIDFPAVVVQPGRNLPNTAAPDVTTPDTDVLNTHVPAASLHRDALAILTVANWGPHKQILELLDAISGLPVTLHLAGAASDTTYAARIMQRAHRPDLAGRVVIHGPVPPDRLPALYRDADLFALPSLDETYGMVFAEAMDYGLPVVAARSGNVPYLVRDGQEGLLAEPGDIAGLRTAIRTLVEDVALRERLAAGARDRARELPAWDDSAALFWSIVRQAIE